MCGIAVVRLRKPLEYFKDKYDKPLWGFNKLFLMMEKQHNRGHDGVGIGCCKLDIPSGDSYISRRRDSEKDGLARLFRKEIKELSKAKRKGYFDPDNPEDLRQHFDFGGEILMGHLRYGTSGAFDESSCHPYLRRSNWPTRTLMVQGNFNMTNTGQLNRKLIARGQHPVFGTDTQTVLEEIGYHLDEEHTELYRTLRDENVAGEEIPEQISEKLDLPKIISKSAQDWDGGYTISGIVGNGDMFVIRDPHGIRPCYYYIDDEVIAVSSGRVQIQTVFELKEENIKELKPGQMLSVKANGEYSFTQFLEPKERKSCSFESIYFSRGNDTKIYQERKQMGRALVPQVMQSIDQDLGKAVFSFIPNTAEIAYYGLLDGLRLNRRQQVLSEIKVARDNGELSDQLLNSLILGNWPKAEKIAHKDIKLRTFISQEKDRNVLASHVYDITYGAVNEDDTLVVLEDSIVRGTTLKKSVLRILSNLNPKKIVVCSTAPQIRYPDCYGIDMAEIGKFIAFQAAENLHKHQGTAGVLKEIYEDCKKELSKPRHEQTNPVQKLYAPFSDDEISQEISAISYPENQDWKGELEIIYLSTKNLHSSLQGEYGDWYFTGDYPTPGGYTTVCRAYIQHFENRKGRAYDLGI